MPYIAQVKTLSRHTIDGTMTLISLNAAPLAVYRTAHVPPYTVMMTVFIIFLFKDFLKIRSKKFVGPEVTTGSPPCGSEFLCDISCR